MYHCLDSFAEQCLKKLLNQNCQASSQQYVWREEVNGLALIRVHYISVYVDQNVDTLATLLVFLLILPRAKHVFSVDATCDGCLKNTMTDVLKYFKHFKSTKQLKKCNDAQSQMLFLLRVCWLWAAPSGRSKLLLFLWIILSLFLFCKDETAEGNPEQSKLQILVPLHMKVYIILQRNFPKALLYLEHLMKTEDRFQLFFINAFCITTFSHFQ